MGIITSAPPPKPLEWLGSSKKDLMALPGDTEAGSGFDRETLEAGPATRTELAA